MLEIRYFSQFEYQLNLQCACMFRGSDRSAAVVSTAATVYDAAVVTVQAARSGHRPALMAAPFIWRTREILGIASRPFG